MNTIKQQRHLSHHAFVIAGEEDAVISELLELFSEAFQFPAQGNPDLWIGKFASFGVDDSRALKALAAAAPVAHEMRIFVIAATSMTAEAQNALLKVLEEPPRGAHFFLIMKTPDALLATLRSRLHELYAGRGGSREEDISSVRSFLDASLPKRLAQADEIAKEHDRQGAMRFADALEIILHEKFLTAEGSARETIAGVLSEIALSKSYLAESGSSPKIILGHIAIALEGVAVGGISRPLK